MAAPAFRSAGEGPTGTTTSTTIPTPAGTIEGDALYALVTNGGAAGAPGTVPSGWSLTIGAVIGTGWAGIYERVAGPAEPNDYTWSGFTDSCAGSMICVSGADTTTPTHKSAATANFDDSTPVGAGVTTEVPECLIVGGCGVGDNVGVSAWACATDPTTLTERTEVPSTGGGDTTSALATAPQISTGATGDLSVTLAGSRNAVVFVVAVQPPQGGGGPAAADATETLTFSESAAAGVTRARAANDLLALAGDTTRAVAATRAGADSLGLVDAAAPSTGRNVAADDTVDLADTAARGLTAARTSSDRLIPGDGNNLDVLYVNDTATRTGAVARAAADQIATTDQAAGTSERSVAASDTLALHDAAARVTAADRAAVDTLLLPDAAATATGQAVSASDTVAVIDNAARTLVHVGTGADGLVLADAVARAVTAERAAGDTLTLADTVTVGAGEPEPGRGIPALTGYPAARLVDRPDPTLRSYGGEVTLR